MSARKLLEKSSNFEIVSEKLSNGFNLIHKDLNTGFEKILKQTYQEPKKGRYNPLLEQWEEDF